MLREYENLIPTEKEKELQLFINKLVLDLYNNEKIKVNSKKLLELLSYLTSNENISTSLQYKVLKVRLFKNVSKVIDFPCFLWYIYNIKRNER